VPFACSSCLSRRLALRDLALEVRLGTGIPPCLGEGYALQRGTVHGFVDDHCAHGATSLACWGQVSALTPFIPGFKN